MVIWDLVFLCGATNVQNSGSILAARYPCIRHGADPVVSLFFLDVFSKIPSFNSLMKFSKRLHNIFGITRRYTTEIFNKYSEIHNRELNWYLSSSLIAGKYK